MKVNLTQEEFLELFEDRKKLAIIFAEYVAKRYTLSKYNEWCSLGMPTINSTEDLFNKFIEEYEG